MKNINSYIFEKLVIGNDIKIQKETLVDQIIEILKTMLDGYKNTGMSDNIGEIKMYFDIWLKDFDGDIYFYAHKFDWNKVSELEYEHLSLLTFDLNEEIKNEVYAVDKLIYQSRKKNPFIKRMYENEDYITICIGAHERIPFGFKKVSK